MIAGPGETQNNGLMCRLDRMKFLANPGSVRAGEGRLFVVQDPQTLRDPTYHVGV